MDITRITWQQVLGICGFWDGSFGKALSWPSRSHTDGSPSTKSVVLHLGIAPWMLKWVAAGCLLKIYNNGWKSARGESVQLLNQSTIDIFDCVLPPALHFSVACVARGWIVTEPTTPVSFQRVVVARVCDALEERVSVASRVRSYSCPRHNDCNHLFHVCVDEPEAMCSVSCSS